MEKGDSSGKQRHYNYDRESFRMAEGLKNRFGLLEDEEQFDGAWAEYFEENPDTKLSKGLKKKTLEAYIIRYESKLPAGQEFQRKKETREKEIERAYKKEKEFRLVGVFMSKKTNAQVQVRAREERILIRNKEVVIFRDRLGRFVRKG